MLPTIPTMAWRSPLPRHYEKVYVRTKTAWILVLLVMGSMHVDVPWSNTFRVLTHQPINTNQPYSTILQHGHDVDAHSPHRHAPFAQRYCLIGVLLTFLCGEEHFSQNVVQ